MAEGARRRAIGTLLACAVSLQASGTLPLLSSAAAASCCCHHEKSLACRCPTCTHARELASNHRFVRTCAGPSEAAVVVTQVAPALPQSTVAVSPRIASAFPIPAPGNGVPSPAREVPTPPPLA
jgi:hypothetical protein